MAAADTVLARPRRRLAVVGLVAALVVATGVVLRFLTTSALWLDEAQSVAIAKQPLSDIPAALRHDGAPPLYYLLLHGWMRLFGDGDAAIRSLSGLASVAAIAVTALAVRALAGRRAAVIAAIVLATNPFAIRYATEARMYGLLALEVALAVLAAIVVVRRPTDPRPAIGLTLATAAALYTHYWSIYMLAAAVIVVAVWRRWFAMGDDRRTCRRLLTALGIGTALWLPWVPSFLEQLRHTGTPWSSAPPPATVISALFDLNGGLDGGGLIITLLALGAVGLALCARRSSTGGLELRRPDAGAPLALLGLAVGTVIIGVGLGSLFGVAYASRYLTPALIPFVMAVAIGLTRPDRNVQRATIGIIAVVGLFVAATAVGAQRTQAVRFARYLESASPGDVVIYCPDQLGPATHRLIGDRLVELGYPRGTAPVSVDWVDYADAWETADPFSFAVRADALAGSHNIWVVVSTNYHGTEADCRALLQALQLWRPYGRVAVAANGHYFENAFLWELPAR